MPWWLGSQKHGLALRLRRPTCMPSALHWSHHFCPPFPGPVAARAGAGARSAMDNVIPAMCDSMSTSCADSSGKFQEISDFLGNKHNTFFSQLHATRQKSEISWKLPMKNEFDVHRSVQLYGFSDNQEISAKSRLNSEKVSLNCSEAKLL